LRNFLSQLSQESETILNKDGNSVMELTWSVLLLLDLILFQIALIEFLFFLIVYDQ
jgi:hypothetical protein